MRDLAILNLVASQPLPATKILEKVQKKDAQVLSDLAAAYIERFESEDKDVRLLTRAVDSCSLALVKNPVLLEAYFNKALALEKLGLVISSGIAWEEYLYRDSASAWAEEARVHLQRLKHPSRQELWRTSQERLLQASLPGQSQLVQDVVYSFPDKARTYVDEDLFGSWGQAYLAGKSPLEEHYLKLIKGIGQALVKVGGDQLISRTVDEIEAGKSSLAAYNLARGFIAYQRAIRLLNSDDFREAESLFLQSYNHLKQAKSLFSSWPLIGLSICDYYSSNYSKSLSRLIKVRQNLDAEAYPILVGRALWVEGLVHFAQSDLLDALSDHISAKTQFRRVGEAITEGYISSLIAADFSALGENSEAWKYRHDALMIVSNIDDKRRIYSVLQNSAEAAAADNEPEAAVVFITELLYQVDYRAEPGVFAEALGRAVIFLSSSGDTKSAASALIRARSSSRYIKNDIFRRRVSSDLDVAEANLEVTRNLDRAQDLLTSALRSYREMGYRAETAELLERRASVRLLLKHRDAAKKDLDVGIQLYEDGLRSLLPSFAKVNDLTSVRRLFDARIDLESDSHDGDKAFEYIERFSALRRRLTCLGPRKSNEAFRWLTRLEARRLLPEGTVLIEYAVTANHLLIWGFGEHARFEVINISEKVLARTVLQHEKDIISDDSGRFSPDLSALLIRPVLPLLNGQVKSLIIVPDKFLEGFPFATLVNPATGRYLIEDFEISSYPSSSAYLGRTARSSLRFSNPSVLAVAGEEISSDFSVFLPRLKNAKGEALFIANLYSKSRVLSGLEATPSRFLREFKSHEVINFSGHAISEPNSSAAALVLAPEIGANGLLRAQDLSGFGAGRARVVVLSGCRTALGSVVGDGGMSLSQSFLNAGVTTVVASLWDVDDNYSLMLLRSFHEALIKGRSASEALRLAQVSLLQSGNPMYRMPKNWAGFVAIGG